jgi:hypothetical protein
MRPATLISAAIRAAKREGLEVARVEIDPQTGRVVIETPKYAAAEAEPVKLDQVDWRT